MKILFVTKRAPFDGLGAEKVIWDIGKRYATEGHDVTFFCPTPTDVEPPDRDDITFEFVKTPGDVTRSQIEFFVRGPPKYPSLYDAIQPDLVYDNPSPFPFHLAHYYGDAPVVSKVHTIYRRDAWIAKDHPLVKLGTMVGDESYRLFGGELFIPVSNSTAKRLEGLVNTESNTIVTNPNGIDLDGYTAQNPPETTQVLYLSKLGRKKGILELIRAWEQVEHQHPDATLRIAGSGPLKAEAEQLVDTLGLRTVQFVGFVADDRKRQLLAESAIFVLPTYIEGMPLTILEAMASGCAVVSTDTYGVRDVVEDGKTGVLVEPGNEEQLARALIDRLADPAGTVAFGTQAQEVAAAYDIEGMVERELEIVDQWLPAAKEVILE